jgi:hypothetical protein
MTSNYGLFYPKGRDSFFGPPVTDVINKTTPEKIIIFYKLNNGPLTNNIVNFLDSAQDSIGNNPFRIIKEAYEAGLGLGNGQSLTEFFFSDSYVMYGKPDSLGHPFYDYKNTTSKYNQIWWLQKNIQPTNPNFVFARGIQQTFGSKINWTSTYLYIDPQTNQQSNKTIDTLRFGNNVTPSEETDLIYNNNNNLYT